MNYKIDDIDRTIIGLLQEDGRMPSTEITRRIGSVSERIIRRRMDKLIKEGVIKVRAIVNSEPIGYPITADVWVAIEGVHIMEVAKQLAEMEQVTYVACSNGEWDISLQVVARNNLELHNFVTDTISGVKGIKKANYVVLPLVIKDIDTWSIPLNTSDNNH